MDRVLIVTVCLIGQFAALAPSLLVAEDPPPAASPQTYTSRNFIVHTDLSKEEAKDLLERLETMLSLISRYWGRPNRKVIECYVVKDLAVWPTDAFPPEGLASIRDKAGITLSRTITVGNRFDATAVVYAIADRGTPQHEAVHAYCAQAFGTTGPVWYSEGMAEMGQYWRKDDPGVNVHDVVLEYLKNVEPKSLNEIVNGQEFTGDSWQNYAWRWALCHLLANNTNYAARFRPLGLDILQQKGTTFEDVYGSMAEEIIFEYFFFLEHMKPGYRVDLCSWDWAQPRSFKGKSPLLANIDADHGWQTTKAQLVTGQEYEYSCEGDWKISKEGDDLTADGDAEGNGKLVGIVFKDYELSEPFDLGVYGSFTSPAEGVLFVRCQDDWGALADNKGKMKFKVREKLANREPLPDPREK